MIIDNIICVLVIVILLISISLQKKKADNTSSAFMLLSHMVIGFQIIDLLTELVDGKTSVIAFSYVVNVLCYLSVDAMIIAFCIYLNSLIGANRSKRENVINLGIILSCVSVLVVIVLFVCGQLFVIDEKGFYQEQSLSSVSYILTGITMVILMIVVIQNKQSFTKQQLIVMILYLLLPLCGTVFELLLDIYEFTTVSVMLSVLLIYAMVQSEIIEGYRIREALLEELSSTDILTKLNNRRSFYNRFSLKESMENTGVVFCDINGLKFTNDHMGHAEGDRMIVHFSEILTEFFDAKDIFRMSGDEFLVVVSDIERDLFEVNADRLQKKVRENHWIAAIGTSYGSLVSVEELILQAEAAMYDDKQKYYNENQIKRGEDRRS